MAEPAKRGDEAGKAFSVTGGPGAEPGTKRGRELQEKGGTVAHPVYILCAPRMFRTADDLQ